MPAALGIVLAAANATTNEQLSDGNDLPFNYVPTGWIGILFIVLFGVTTAGHLLQALVFRTTYMIPTLVLCGIGELLGWAGRYWGHVNPYNEDAFMMQITTTIIAPSFMTAAMFLILPKIINELGTGYSRMPPRLYSIIFITADVTALVIQAVGGAMASIANTLDGAERGGRIMLGGIVIQLVAVVLYTLLGLEFSVRFGLDRPVRASHVSDQRKHAGWIHVPRGIVWMLVGLIIATIFIIIRSIYRTIELTDGWNGGIISTEKWFNWFDGAPIVVAMFTFNVFHPGYFLRNLESDNRLPTSKNPSTEGVEMGKP
ncbi:RTA1-like protein [Rhizoctonia solani]|uniref:RTA1-like protein n=1 Tax=Rhizoctonia solani TaxID=456999 RepID=A0A8H8SXK1_9AGAM|nr:RTA1-like protein [Rhizoctonia solani]QRW20637.1 RTA1-like protein [Rhizoctonia solani]